MISGGKYWSSPVRLAARAISIAGTVIAVLIMFSSGKAACAADDEKTVPVANDAVKNWRFITLPDHKRIAKQIAQDVRIGMEAAQAGLWSIAMRHLEAARDNNPPAQVLFNLALVYDRSKVHPLAAAAQYRAYLAVAGDANNAARVRERVRDLLAGNLKIIQALAKNVEKLAVSARTSAVSVQERQTLGSVLGKVAFAHVLLGNEAEADRIVSQVAWHDEVRDEVTARVAIAFCMLHDAASAERWLERLIDPSIREQFARHKLCAKQMKDSWLDPGYFGDAIKYPIYPLMDDRRRDNWHRYIRDLGVDGARKYDPAEFWRSVENKPAGELAALLAERLSLLTLERSGYRLRDEGWSKVYKAYKELEASQ